MAYTVSTAQSDLAAMFAPFVIAYRFTRQYAPVASRYTVAAIDLTWGAVCKCSDRVTPEDIAALKAVCLDLMAIAFLSGVVVRRHMDDWVNGCQSNVPAAERKQLQRFDAELAAMPVAPSVTTIEQLEAEVELLPDPWVEPVAPFSPLPTVAQLHTQPPYLLLLPPAKMEMPAAKPVKRLPIRELKAIASRWNKANPDRKIKNVSSLTVAQLTTALAERGAIEAA